MNAQANAAAVVQTVLTVWVSTAEVVGHLSRL